MNQEQKIVQCVVLKIFKLFNFATDVSVGDGQEKRNIGHSEEVKKRIQGQCLKIRMYTKNVFFNFHNGPYFIKVNFTDRNQVTKEELELDSLRSIHTQPNLIQNGASTFFILMNSNLFKTLQ